MLNDNVIGIDRIIYTDITCAKNNINCGDVLNINITCIFLNY